MNTKTKKTIFYKSEQGTKKEFFVSMMILLFFWIILSLPPYLFTLKGLISLIQHVFVGIPLAYLVVRLTNRPILSLAEINFFRLTNIVRVLSYFFYLIGQIFLGGFDVVRRVMRPRLDISPGVIKFHTPLRDELPIIINANSITLTPGTITIDVEQNEQGSTFWVHCISKQGLEDIKTNKGFVDKIKSIVDPSSERQDVH